MHSNGTKRRLHVDADGGADAAACAVQGPMLDLLGANDGSAALARLSRECYSVFLLCFVSQGFFSLACCLLFFEEKRKLLAANLILYAILLSGCALVTASGPSMTGYTSFLTSDSSAL